MGKKLGLDKSYNALKTVLGSYPITGGKFPKGSFMERRLEIGAGSGGKKYPSALTTSVNKGSKLLNVGKKVFGRTPVGKAVNLAVNVGSGFGKALKKTLTSKTNIGVSSAIVGFEAGKKTDKKMAGGMMQGYGAARTSGMGLEDQSLMPGQMVRASKGKMTKLKKAALTTTALLGANYLGKRSGEKAVIDSINSGQAFKPEGAKMSLFGVSLKRSKGGGMDMGKKGKMLSAKQKKIARMAPPPDKITGADFKAMKAKNGKMVKMNKGGGMDMGAKKPLSFKEQLEQARAEDKVEKTPKSTYLKKRSRGDKINALLKAANVPNMNKGGKMVKMNKGGGMDMGTAQGKVDRIRAAYNLAKKNKGEDRLTQADIKMAEKTLKAYENLKKNK